MVMSKQPNGDPLTGRRQILQGRSLHWGHDSVVLAHEAKSMSSVVSMKSNQGTEYQLLNTSRWRMYGRHWDGLSPTL